MSQETTTQATLGTATADDSTTDPAQQTGTSSTNDSSMTAGPPDEESESGSGASSSDIPAPPESSGPEGHANVEVRTDVGGDDSPEAPQGPDVDIDVPDDHRLDIPEPQEEPADDSADAGEDGEQDPTEEETDSDGADDATDVPAADRVDFPLGEPVTPDASHTVREESIPAAEDEAWMDLFPYRDAHPEQADGIRRVIDTLSDGGFLAMEGACGTGKTILSAVGALTVQREQRGVASATTDCTTIERIMAVTPVKQQLKQFVAEARVINAHLTAEDRDGDAWGGTDAVKTIALRGKGDMLAYARADSLPKDFDAQGTLDIVDDLRETTREVIKTGSTVPLEFPDDECPVNGCGESLKGEPTCPNHGTDEEDEDSPWYDPVRARVLVENAEYDPEEDGARLTVNGIETPYAMALPHTQETIDYDYDGENGMSVTSDGLGNYDPFYAAVFAKWCHPQVAFTDGEAQVLDGDTLVEHGAAAGVCPHETMALLMEDAELVIGNYNHLFDPQSRQLTSGKADIIDRETAVIVDEAHMLEGRVRDMLSDEVGFQDLRTSANDVEAAMAYLTGSEGDADSKATAEGVVNEMPAQYRPDQSDFQEARTVLRWIEGWVGERIDDYLTSEYDDWERAHERGQLDDSDSHEVPLEPADSIPDGPDEFTEALEESFDDSVWGTLNIVGVAAYDILDSVEDADRSPKVHSVADFLTGWRQVDPAQYFKEITLDYSPKEDPPADAPVWYKAFTPEVTLFNCIPSGELAAIFDQVGGGVLMSATLAPFDTFSEVSGLLGLESGEATTSTGGDVELDDRRVERVRYPLSFPEENRASFTVDCDPYTRSNRGYPARNPADMTETRETYLDTMENISRTQGNVLLCLPNYGEAQWAATQLRSRLSKQVLCDESSSDEQTQRLLEQFFDGEGKVLLTSTRGTVTEGVDYDGDKLSVAGVIGIPYVNIGSPRVIATKTAYDETFSTGDGFETALTVPAVRKARQALGRVIRGTNEEGVRFLVDGRYDSTAWNGVRDLLSPQEQEEFNTIQPDTVGTIIDSFDLSGV